MKKVINLLEVEDELLIKLKNSKAKGELNWMSGQLGIGIKSLDNIISMRVLTELSLSKLENYYKLYKDDKKKI